MFNKKVTLMILVSFLSCILYGRNKDYFEPYLNDESPKILEIVSKTVEDGIEMTNLKFLSRDIPDTNDDAIIYGILARPTGGGVHPGILFCHGGGGYAKDDYTLASVKSWAKLGYVVFCQDEPGVYNAAKGNSTGPWLRGDRNIINFNNDLSETSLYDGVVAALNGLRILRSQSYVDKKRIGVIGGSWGGYMTTIVAGISGNRINTMFSIYGCGYYDVGSMWMPQLEALPEVKRQMWLKALDAGRWASNIKATYFVFSPANDWYFWPSAVMATYNDVKGAKNLVFSPNDSHDLSVPGGMHGPQDVNFTAHRGYAEIAWMEYYLKGKGKPFAKCTAEKRGIRKGNDVEVKFKVDAKVPIKRTQVWYSYGEMPWRTRLWIKAEAKKISKDKYAACVPVYETEYPMSWFGLAIDERDITTGTTMQEFNPADLGFKASEKRNLFFNEDFEGELAKERWKKPYPFGELYEEASFVLCPQAAHSGKRGLQMKGKLVLRYDGIRGTMLKNSGSKGISFWAKSPGGTGFDVVLMAEKTNGIHCLWKTAVVNPGNEWKEIKLGWDKFVYDGDNPPDFEMLSPRLGQLRFCTPAGSEVCIDDIVTMTE